MHRLGDATTSQWPGGDTVNRAGRHKEAEVKPRIKIGLVAGAIGLALNICVSFAIGICGPFTALVAGAVAGYFAASEEKPAARREGAKVGAIAGGIAGALVLVGQVIGGLGALVLVRNTGTRLPIGRVPPPGAGPAELAFYYVLGVALGACLGVVGILLAGLAGAGTGYLATPELPRPAGAAG